MNLEYVGAKPIVDQHGVGFDRSEPDRYIFIQAVLEILENIERCHDDRCGGIVDITGRRESSLGALELAGVVKRYCSDKIEEILQENERRLDGLLSDYRQKVDDNGALEEDEKRAWLGNIDIMEGYYRQFIQNEIVFECLLDVLAHLLYEKKILEIVFELGSNYGFVFSYLQNVLGEHRPPIDADMQIEVKEGRSIGHFYLRHPKKADV